MHCRRSHGERCQARKFVIGPVRPTSNANFVTKGRIIDHISRGSLACALPWRLGALPEFPPEQVEQADLAQRESRSIQRRLGSAPAAGIPYVCGR